MRVNILPGQSKPKRNLSSGAIACGLVAGLAGTAVMSLSQKAEMKATGREASVTPAEAICLLLGFTTRDSAREQRLAQQVHWVYGTMWGLGQSVLSHLPEPARWVLHLLAVWSAGTTLLTTTGLAPPPTKWKKQSLLMDLGHHAVYAGAVAVAYRILRF